MKKKQTANHVLRGMGTSFIAILVILLLVLQPYSAPDTPLPTLMYLPTNITTADSVAPTTTSPEISSDLPTAIEQAAIANIAQVAIDVLPEEPISQNPITVDIPDTAIPDRVVIRFQSGVSHEDITNYIESIQGRVVQEIAALNTVVVEVTAEIAQNPLPPSALILGVELDYYMKATAISTPTTDERYPEQWALPAIHLPTAWANLPDDLPQLMVAVIDSGVCSNHPDLQGNVMNGRVFVKDGSTILDEFGHGCGVSGILAARINDGEGIAGVAPNIVILPLKVLDKNGIGSYSDVAAAIIYAADSGASIINLSLGGNAPSQLLEDAVKYALSKDVLLVAAAGNTQNDTLLYPAALDGVIAVGAVNVNLVPSRFSSSSPTIDVWAPGEAILTTNTDGGYSLLSGTSFAAPHVAGVAALQLAQGEAFITNGKLLSAVTLTDEAPIPTPTPFIPEEYTKVAPEVIQEIQQNGQAHVLINLFDPITVQADLDVQAAAVNQIQEAVLAQLTPDEFVLTQQYRTAPGMAGIITQAALNILQADPSVVSVTYDMPTWSHSAEGVRAVEADRVYSELGYTGKGVTVAVLDTGVYTQHPALRDSIVAQYCVTDNACPPNDTSTGSSAEDDDGHGTNVSGIITANRDFNPAVVGVAPDADIVAVKVLDESGMGRASEWIAGLQWVLQQVTDGEIPIRVINLSLGTEPLTGICDANFPSAATLIRQLNAWNVVVFASSGNQGDLTGVSAPACLSGVIAVGATYDSDLGRQPSEGKYSAQNPDFSDCFDPSTSTSTLACFTNRGDQLDILAPGVSIINTGTLADNGISEYAGTSQASPNAAGTAALMLEANPYLTPAQIETILKEETGIHVLDNATGQSYPLINAFQAVQAAEATVFSCSNVTQIPQAECDGLVELYFAMGGQNWINQAGWLADYKPCSWFGVDCQGEGSPDFNDGQFMTRISGLDLHSNHLVGSIPEVIGSFPNLTTLLLQNNVLSGSVPENITELTQLSRLDIGYNMLSASGAAEVFLDHLNPEWNRTQTVAPKDVNAFATSLTSITVLWRNVPYTEDEGHYEVSCTSPGIQLNAATENKLDHEHTFENVQPNTRYQCSVSTFTQAHGQQLNDLSSLPSSVAIVETTPEALQSQDYILTPTQDIFIAAVNAAPNRDAIFIGTYTDYTAQGDPVFLRSRGLLDFGTVNLPANAVIDRASVQVWYYGTNPGFRPVHISRITTGWNEASGRGHPAYDAYVGDYGSSLFNDYDRTSPVQWDIPISDLSLINTLTQANYGIMLKYATGEEDNGGVVICSSEPNVGRACNSGNYVPRLVIHFKINDAPPIPMNPLPVSGSVDQDMNLTLTWDSAPDKNGDPITYDVYFGIDPNVLNKVGSVTERNFTPTITQPGKYYWRVVARDAYSATNGEIWDFTTQVCGAVTEIPVSECEALRALYLGTNGQEWQPATNWLTDTSPCSWTGITCSENHIVDISLANQGLAGSLPYELGNLLELHTLNLADNFLTGSIPSSLGHLPKLETLDLHHNRLTGIIPPELGMTDSLQHLRLQQNDLSGSIPASLGNLTHLKQLRLEENRLSGSIPSTLGYLIYLEILTLQENQLEGFVPPELGNLVNLIQVNLSYNNLGGDVPGTIRRLERLADDPEHDALQLSYNRLSASDPLTEAFLDLASPGWATAQTVPPSDIHLIETAINSADLSWTLPLYLDGGGHYQILCGDTPTGGYVLVGETVDKLASTFHIMNLLEGTNYYCVIKTFTPASGKQKSDLLSIESQQISLTTDGELRGTNPCEAIPVEGQSILLNVAPSDPPVGDPPTDCDPSGGGGGSWFSGRFGGGKTVRFTTTNSNFDTLMIVYKGEPGSLTEVARNDDYDNTQTHGDAASANGLDSSKTSLVEIQTEANVTYYIVVIDKSGIGGRLVFSATEITFTTCTDIQGISTTECEGLLALYRSSGGESWYHQNGWGVTNDPCLSWWGVTCSDNGAAVTGLDLSSNNLNGFIPPEIAFLTGLRRLELDSNFLRGEVTPNIVRLTGLEYTDIGYNLLMAVDPATLDFLNLKDPNWAETQTASPTRLGATALSAVSIELFWQPVRYVADGGWYEISYSTTSGGPYTVYGVTTDKQATHYRLDNLQPMTTYYFVVRTYTSARNLWSIYSPEVAATTLLPPTITIPISSGMDDVNEDNDFFDIVSSRVWIGTGASGSPDYTGLRFCGVNIPQNATILDAYLEFYTSETTWIPVHVSIAAEAADNSLMFVTDDRPSQRFVTSARVTHASNSQWVAGQWYPLQADGMNTVIQEVISRDGWRSGNCLAVIMRGIGSEWGRKYLTSYDADSLHSPRLVVNFAAIQPTPTLIQPTAIPTPVPVNMGAGLHGEYFDDIEFRVPVGSRTDAYVDFDWSTNAPLPGMGTEAFAVRWTGQVQPLYSDLYTFSVVAGDGARLWVDNQLILDNWLLSNTPTEMSGQIALVASHRYDIRLEYYNYAGPARISLLWASPSQEKQVIPPTCLLSPLSSLVAIEYQISASSDDVNEDNQVYESTQAEIWIGNGEATRFSVTGLRFADVQIPRASNIVAAYLDLYNPQDAWINVDTGIVGEAADNSQTFTVNSRPSQRLYTQHYTLHSSNVMWKAGQWYTFGNIASVVQEIIARPGWQTGNSLSLLMGGTGRKWGRKYIASYDGSPQHAPKLIIVYGIGSMNAQYENGEYETPVWMPTAWMTATLPNTMTRIPTATTDPGLTTVTSVPTETPELTQEPTAALTETLIPTETPTEIEIPTLTVVPTIVGTATPIETPAATPTEGTMVPTAVPTSTETPATTEVPTVIPTEGIPVPTVVPTSTGTAATTEVPTMISTEGTPVPTAVPTSTEAPAVTELPTEIETST